MRKIFLYCLFFAFPFLLNGADDGFTSGVKFAGNKTTIGKTGTTPTTGEFYLKPGSNVTITPSTVNGSTTFDFASTGGGGGSNATETIFFQGMNLPSDGFPGLIDQVLKTAYLSATQTMGVEFSSIQVPQKTATGTRIYFSFLVETPDFPGASTTVIQLNTQILGQGKSHFKYSNYLALATATVTLISTISAQLIQPVNFFIPLASMTRGNIIHTRLRRIGANGSDNHGDYLHIIGGHARYQYVD